MRFSVKVSSLARLVELLRLSVCVCEDRTLSNSFVEVVITADSFKRCVTELNAQLSDGIFESCAVGMILIQDIEKKYDGYFESIKDGIDDVLETIK